MVTPPKLKPFNLNIVNGRLQSARFIASPFFDSRSEESQINLLVVHNISLPPNQFGGGYVDQLFTGKLNPAEHDYFEKIHQMKVSAHCLIERNGNVTQYVSFLDRAWHAGISSFQGISKCNDYAIGIELEGADHILYTNEQYQSLVELSDALMNVFPEIKLSRIVGHNDIAPGRKTDPGFSFDWTKFRTELAERRVTK